MNKTRKYELWIDFLKGFTMIFVIYEHTCAYEWRIGNILCTYAMPLYFVLSGYLSSQNSEESYCPFVKKKAYRLLLPYIIYSLILIILKFSAILIQHERFDANSFLGILYGRYMMFNTTSVNDPSNTYFFTAYNSTLWFLLALFVGFLLFGLFLRAKNNSRILLLIIALFSSIICYFLPVLLPWSIDVAGVIFLFLVVGFVVRNSRISFKIWHTIIFGLIYVLTCYFNGANNISVRKYGNHEAISIILYVLAGIAGTLTLLSVSKALYNVINSNKGNTAQLAANASARHLLAYFPSYYPNSPCVSKAASNLGNLTKNLTSHLTHRGCAVLPKENRPLYLSVFEYIGRHSITFMSTQLLFISLSETCLNDFISNRIMLGIIEIVVALIGCFIISIILDRLSKVFKFVKVL